MLTGVQISSLLAIRLISLSWLKMNTGLQPHLSKGPLLWEWQTGDTHPPSAKDIEFNTHDLSTP